MQGKEPRYPFVRAKRHAAVYMLSDTIEMGWEQHSTRMERLEARKCRRTEARSQLLNGM